MVESGLGISSKSGTEQCVSSKNELGLIQIGETLSSVSVEISVRGAKTSKYSGLRLSLVNVPTSRRWNCSPPIFEPVLNLPIQSNLCNIFN